jgi:hypothetical protein
VSGFTEHRKLAGVESVPNPNFGVLDTKPRPGSDADEAVQVIRWRKKLETRKGLEDYKTWEKYRDEAKQVVLKGELLDGDAVKAWKSKSGDGVVIQVNLAWRILNFYLDAIFSDNPNIAVRGRPGRINDQVLKWASSVEAMLKYVWDDTKQRDEVKRTLKEAWLSGIAAAHLVHDPARDLWKMQWCAGPLIVDPECHGDLKRARWYAIEYKMPALSVLRDKKYPADKRARLYQKWESAFTKSAEGPEVCKTVYEVYSREGLDPLAALRELTGEMSAEGEGAAAPEVADGKVKFVICEGFDEYLMAAPEPCPYLDEDEANVAVLVLDEAPGLWFPPPVWKMFKGLIEAINWLVSFHTTDMKKKATDVILTNKEIFKDGPNKITGSAHCEVHEISGDPKMAAARVDLGKGDMTSLQSADGLLAWLERISGFNEVARGESSGRKTATEAESLQRNTSLVTKGANQQFDAFLKECLRLVGLATLYYVPAFSRVIGPDGMVMTQQAVQVPAMPPMGAGPEQNPQPGMGAEGPAEGPPAEGPPQPGAGPAPMQPQMQTVLQPMPVDPEEAMSLGAVPSEVLVAQAGIQAAMPDPTPRMPDTQVTSTPESVDEFGNVIPGVPMFQHPTPGKILRRGVDYYCGPEVAANWPTQPLEDIKRDLLLTFEAGSTRADYRYDQQQSAMAALQVLGPIYQSTGSFNELYELLVVYTQSLPLSDSERLIPPREMFVGGMQMAVQQAQMQAQAEQQRADREVGAKEKKAEGGPPK